MEELLIVEDERDIRETLQEMLELAGYNVRAAKNGREGFEAIMNKRPDLVLCDVNMPQLDGFQLLELINQRLKDEVIPPFLFLTAKVEKQDIREGMNLGAEDYILKPFDHSDILRIIRLRLDKRKKLLKTTENGSLNSISNGSSLGKLALPCEDGLEMIAFDKIIRCQADRAYCNFFLNDGRSILVSKPMKEFELSLTERDFVRVHKSTIININHIDKFVRGKNGYVIMSDGTSVSVSASKKEVLMQILRPGA